jgi:hypothetical protein
VIPPAWTSRRSSDTAFAAQRQKTVRDLVLLGIFVFAVLLFVGT